MNRNLIQLSGLGINAIIGVILLCSQRSQVMAQIFVSYSRANRQFIDQLIPLIRRVYGNDCVWFDNDIHGGADWWQMILNEIEKCALFIYLISNEALESPYCQAELREALRLNKHILPVIVHRLTPPYPGNTEPDLAAILRRTQYVDMSSGLNDPNTISLLYAAINRLLDLILQQSVQTTSVPILEPSVPDKKPNTNIRASYIAGTFALLATIVAGILGLWQGILANNGASSADVSPTTAVAQVEMPTEQSTPTLTATSEPALTQTLENQPASITPKPLNTSTNIPTATVIIIINTPMLPTYTPSVAPTFIPAPASSTPQATELQSTPWQPTLFSDPLIGHTSVFVPEGLFEDENGSTSSAFWIDAYEVTNELYLEFINARGLRDSSQMVYYDINARSAGIIIETGTFGIRDGMEHYPVVEVSWVGADAYCAWVGGRLPSATEWHKAAVWDPSLHASYTFPWGNHFDETASNVQSGQLLEVGSHPEGMSHIGAFDMVGNVTEWTSNTRGINRFYVGSSFADSWRSVSLSTLQQATDSFHSQTIGFRCVFNN